MRISISINKPETLIHKLPLKNINREQLLSLAEDLSSGISHKEVTRRFVDASSCSLKDRLSVKDYQNLVDQITEFLLDDRQFIKDLFGNLLNISAEKVFDLNKLKLLETAKLR